MIATLLLANSRPASAQEKKDAPRITAISPIRVTPGTSVTFKIRGVKLDSATELRFPSVAGLKAEVKEKKKADLPNGLEAKDVGDTQCEATLMLPADLPAGMLAVEVVTPGGTSEPREVSVGAAAALLEEKDPNNEFGEAQKLELAQVITGRVKEERDVDVFSVNLTAGQSVSVEVTAARCSSLLDPLLSIFDANRRLLRSVDDAATRDAALTFAPPQTGAYFIVLQDAGDRGGAWHNYELLVKAAP